MEEMATLPISNRDIMPKNNLDRGLFVIMTAGIPLIATWETLLLFQYYPETGIATFIYLLIESFLIINIIGNLYYLQRTDSSAKRQTLPSILYPSWKYCHFCQINSPPRSYHCPICDECILKRDQHCMFAGNCVGYYNHRYYLMSIAYIATGSLFAVLFQWPHCLESVGGFHLLSLLSMTAPHIAVLFGFLSIYGFICAVTQIMLCCIFVIIFYMFLIQIKCITSGQTIHEKKADITLYDLGLRKNIIQVLGSKWYFALFCPFVSSPLDGDGLSFVTFYDLGEIKNV